ncbi:FAD-dependent oxidoreductase [Candidatus Kaiserbacteria bacterium]|nr:FAD-dependent oxidoreductase [Candidatus Kaiserbacteria bacterium]
MYELAIVGGGPAGAAAAVYAARKRLKTLMIVDEWGGQSGISMEVQNWIGTPSISGADLADALKKHAQSYAGDYLTIRSPERATGLTAHEDHVEITTGKGFYAAKTLLITTGASRRKLEVPGAKEFDQKGLTYCASCDGPLFADKDVVVIGGGNAGFETALQLLEYCKSVTLLHHGAEFKADAISVEAAVANPKMRAVTRSEPLEVTGEQFVSGLRFKHLDTGEEEKIAIEGVFVEIGIIPNTQWLGDAVEMTPFKQVVVDPATQRTSHPHIWAAGDVANGHYHQNNIAAGDAVKALEDIYMHLRRS